MQESTEPITHNPCCSSHGVPMTCERYRQTHFVEVRPCCAIDADRLAVDLYGKHAAVDDVCHRTDVRCHVEQFKRHHPDRPLPTPPTRHALVQVVGVSRG